MIFLLGLLGFFQVVFIPGFIAVKYTGLKIDGRIRKLVHFFTFSLLINYLLVFLFTTLKIYSPAAVYGVILIEALLLVLFYRKNPPDEWKFRLDLGKPVRAFGELTGSRSVLFNVCFVLALVAMALLVYYFILRFKSVFYFNDAILSWNKWATHWYNNLFPINTWLYPQMHSANWSITYQIMQTADIQFIPRNINALFAIGTGLLFFDLGLKKKNGLYFLGMAFYVYITLFLYEPGLLMGGFMDIPVMFFCFLAFYELHLADDTSFNTRRVVMSVIFACTAAVTKQAGFYVLLVVLVWNTRLMIKNRRSLDMKKVLKITGIILLLIAVIVGTWYGFRIVLINQGIESAGVKAVTMDVHQNRTAAERWDYGFSRILNAGGKKNDLAKFLVHLAVLLMIMGVFPKRTRYVVLFFVVPYTLMWGFLFSYDYRNLSAAFPFMGLSMAFGGHWLFSRIGICLKKIRRMEIPVWQALVALLTVILILNFTVFSSGKIKYNQLEQQRHLGDDTFNRVMYKYYEKHGFDGKVYSKYPFFKYLPALRDYWTEDRHAEGVKYLLEDMHRPNQKILKEVKQNIRNGKYKILLKYMNYRLLEVQPGGKDK